MAYRSFASDSPEEQQARARRSALARLATIGSRPIPKHCTHGHELNEQNLSTSEVTLFSKTTGQYYTKPRWRCKQCLRERRLRRYYEKKNAERRGSA